jgi:hypothetical protein
MHLDSSRGKNHIHYVCVSIESERGKAAAEFERNLREFDDRLRKKAARVELHRLEVERQRLEDERALATDLVIWQREFEALHVARWGQEAEAERMRTEVQRKQLEDERARNEAAEVDHERQSGERKTALEAARRRHDFAEAVQIGRRCQEAGGGRQGAEPRLAVAPAE